MANVLLQNILRFVVLIAMQIFLFKNMGYYNLIAPFPYILFILLLPIGISNGALFVLAFLTGLTVDVFYDTLGVNAGASTTLAWIRIIFMRLTLEQDNHEKFATPLPAEIPYRWFLPYVLVGAFFHHLTLYILEVFSFRHFHLSLLSTILSCIFTVVIIFLFSLLAYRKKQR